MVVSEKAIFCKKLFKKINFYNKPQQIIVIYTKFSRNQTFKFIIKNREKR